MTQPVSDLDTLLATMSPTLDRRTVAFVSLQDGVDALAGLAPDALIGTFREREGLTAIVELAVAESRGWPVLFRAAWITLTVHSDLEAVGLTAAFATALGAAGISCNVVAAAFHDHIFVPVERADDAMTALRQLQQDASRGALIER